MPGGQGQEGQGRGSGEAGLSGASASRIPQRKGFPLNSNLSEEPQDTAFHGLVHRHTRAPVGSPAAQVAVLMESLAAWPPADPPTWAWASMSQSQGREL